MISPIGDLKPTPDVYLHCKHIVIVLQDTTSRNCCHHLIQAMGGGAKFAGQASRDLGSDALVTPHLANNSMCR